MDTTQQEQLVRGIMDNFPEAGRCNVLQCIRANYSKLDFTFVDDEQDTHHPLDKAKLLAAVPLIFTNKWPKGCTKTASINTPSVTQDDVDDWLCTADAQDFDAFIQLAILGEVIYG
jgi:hypothetical protein